MGSHPINLIVRFLLEMIALISIGAWGWNKTDGINRYILAIGLPLLMAVIWGVFAVPNDPSRSGQTVVVTSGIVRLVIELTIFVLATLAIFNSGQQKLSYTFALVVFIHYLTSYDRIRWLLDN
ncbi:YrdB family protein [Algoriphagus sp. SE2]|uniref:YrdB family protein n=1 Tax=Algoriphagus sp. SE2 TaxID=3141536 RepID=UPI0031CCEB40